jgi:penicillin amidase
MSGTLPLRRKGSGTFPIPGWDSDYGWAGYVPPAKNPGAINPPSGIIVSANNRTIPVDYPVQVTHSWMPPYRARRIEQLLTGRNSLTPEDMQFIQLDRRGLETKPWLQALRNLEQDIRVIDPDLWPATGEVLVSWDGWFGKDSRAAALFVHLRHAMLEAIFADELGDALQGFMDMHLYAYGALQETIRTGKSSFWDDVRTPGIETPVQIWTRALQRVAAESGGTLGQLRQLVFPHAFHNIPLMGALFDVGPLGTGGDNHTVNVVKAAINKPEEPLFVPVYRVICPAGEWEQVLGTQTLGQSGHRFSPYRRDQLDDWREGDVHTWSWNGPPADEMLGELQLLPERKCRSGQSDCD